MSVKDILHLIETVSPDDADKLDEIDAKVEHYLYWQGTKIKEILLSSSDEFGEYISAEFTTEDGRRINVGRYSRSRGALKAIRPDGLKWILKCYVPTGEVQCPIYGMDMMVDNLEWRGVLLPTEELAELHTTLLAIERGRLK